MATERKISLGWVAIQIPIEYINDDDVWHVVEKELRYFCMDKEAFRLEGPPVLKESARFFSDSYDLVFPVAKRM